LAHLSPSFLLSFSVITAWHLKARGRGPVPGDVFDGSFGSATCDESPHFSHNNDRRKGWRFFFSFELARWWKNLAARRFSGVRLFPFLILALFLYSVHMV
jgi:hypothetical protein